MTDPWTNGMTVEGTNITPVMLTEIYRQIKIFEGYRAYECWARDEYKTFGDLFDGAAYSNGDDKAALPVKMTDEDYIEIYETYHDSMECESGSIEREAVIKVLEKVQKRSQS